MMYKQGDSESQPDLDQELSRELNQIVTGLSLCDLLVKVGVISTLADNQKFTMRFNYLVESICSNQVTLGSDETDFEHLKNMVSLINERIGPRINLAESEKWHNSFLTGCWYQNKHYYLFSGDMRRPLFFLRGLHAAGRLFKGEMITKFGFDIDDVLGFLLPLVDNYVQETNLSEHELTFWGDFGNDAVTGALEHIQGICEIFQRSFVFESDTLKGKHRLILMALSKDIGTYSPKLSDIIYSSDLDIHPVVRVDGRYIIPFPQAIWLGISSLFRSFILKLPDEHKAEDKFNKATLRRVFGTLAAYFGEEIVFPLPTCDSKPLGQIAVNYDTDKFFQVIVASTVSGQNLQTLTESLLTEASIGWNNFVKVGTGLIGTPIGDRKTIIPSNLEPIRLIVIDDMSDRENLQFIENSDNDRIIMEAMSVDELEYILSEMQSPMQFLKYLRVQGRFLRQYQHVARLSILDCYAFYRASRSMGLEFSNPETKPMIIALHNFDDSELDRRRKQKQEHEELIIKYPEADYVVHKLDEDYYSGENPFTLEKLTVIKGNITVYIFVPQPREITPETVHSIVFSSQVLEHYLAKNKGIQRVIRQVEPNLNTIHIHVHQAPTEMPNQDGIIFQDISKRGNERSLLMLVGSRVSRRLITAPNEFERYVMQALFEFLGLLDKLELILGQSRDEVPLGRKVTVGEMLDFDSEFVHSYPEDVVWIQEIEQEALKKSGAKKAIVKGKDKERKWLIHAHDHLLSNLRERISYYDIQDLAPAVYDQTERISISREKRLIEAALLSQRSGPKRIAPPESVRRIEEEVAEHSVAYKYLLEAVIKISPNGDKPLTEEALTELLALAKRISAIDFELEWMNYGIFPIELHITEERHTYFVDRDSSDGAERVTIGRAQHRIASTLNRLAKWERSADSEEEQMSSESRQLIKDADEAFKDELGYSFTERGKIEKALVNWFYQQHQYLRKIDRTELFKELADATMLPSVTIESILQDKELSADVMDKIQWENMWPAEFFWRDQRLLNRPIVTFLHNGRQTCIYGYKTNLGASDLFLYDFINGHRLPLSRMKQGGPVSKLQNKWQKESAEEFRTGIRDLCQEYGLEACIEKSNAGHIKMEGKGLGPIDVFAVDLKHKRFLLVEAKDVMPRISPKDIATERDLFFGKPPNDSQSYVQKLRRKLDWFGRYESELKQEYGVEISELWGIEALFVTSNPLIIQYFETSPFRIFWVDDFEDMLAGRQF